MKKEARFTEAMVNIYTMAKKDLKYNASYFFRMIQDLGGLQTAKQLINDSKPSSGFTTLYERGRLDLTVEALVVDNQEWHELFTREELVKAEKRLVDLGYRSQ